MKPAGQGNESGMGKPGTTNILTYDISTSTGGNCIDLICSWIRAGEKGKYFVCANPHSLEVARNDRVFDEAIRNADLIVPDGVGVVLASRLLGSSIRERVTGSDIFRGLNQALNPEGRYSCFFLGSSDECLQEIKEKMEREYPGIRVVGTYSPPFRQEFSDEESAAMIAAVNKAAPDVLWVGMTAPKQEKWIFRNRDRLNAGFIAPVGAVFDFFIGRVKRSHPFFQALGLEWLPRLIQEPRRLWRRNFISNPRFIGRVICSFFRSAR
jgi:N-acetylglucosaminyldiphosphoundecaprenol N-acetyl-beta-D-mannosaminyltransferase